MVIKERPEENYKGEDELVEMFIYIENKEDLESEEESSVEGLKKIIENSKDREEFEELEIKLEEFSIYSRPEDADKKPYMIKYSGEAGFDELEDYFKNILEPYNPEIRKSRGRSAHNYEWTVD